MSIVNAPRSGGFEDIEKSLLAAPPPSDGHRRTTAGEAGGRGGRVLRRELSLKGAHEVEGNRARAGSSAAVTEADRPRYKKLAEDTHNLVNWFAADPVDGPAKAEGLTLGDFKDACKSLGIDFANSPQLVQLCENDDLSTSVRAVQLLNSKAKSAIKELDDLKKKEREAAKAKREAAKAKKEADKKAKRDAKEKAKKDADNILAIEASIILTLERGGLPFTESGRGNRVSQETMFYRYNDNGLQFQFGSADFASMTFKTDGTFEFKNGYKMEFSSARQFVEQSEGLFDDLKGTYDIVWGEMKADSNGKKVRKLTKLPTPQVETRPGVAAPRRPVIEKKKSSIGSSRMLLGRMGSSVRGMGSSVMRKMGSVRVGGGSGSGGGGSGGVSGGGGELLGANKSDVPQEDVWIPTPLEIILHPSDMEARRQGIDLKQRWGCYEPQGELDPEDPGKCKVMKIQRKLTPTEVGPYIFPFDPNAKLEGN